MARKATRRGRGPAQAGDGMMTPAEAAAYLGVHVNTLYRLAKGGKVPAVRIGRSWRFRRAVLDEWISAQEARAS